MVRRRHRHAGGSGSVYRQRTRSKYWYLKFRFPGEPIQRRVTNPPTEDRAEAERQLHELLAERRQARRHRQTADTVTVADLLDRYLLYVADHGRQLQVGRIEPWYHALGDTLAAEVTGADVEDLCRRWMQHGPTWRAGSRTLPDGRTVTWPARERKRVRPLAGASVNRLVAVLRKAFTLGRKQLNLFVPLSFPHFEEHGRGEYITEDQCQAICANYQAKVGREVKAKVFRLAYVKGVRKGQLRNTRKKNLIIKGDLWKLEWEPRQTKTKKKVHSVVLTGEARAIVEWAWANRLPECDFLFHVDGQPLGPMRSELKRTCTRLGIPYGRATGIVFHDTRHSAVTNLVATPGVSEATAMSITGHADPAVFKGYNVPRDAVQAEAAERLDAYLEMQRGTTPTVPVIGRGPTKK
jgi:integrase